jgi:hypothetical protein
VAAHAFGAFDNHGTVVITSANRLLDRNVFVLADHQDHPDGRVRFEVDPNQVSCRVKQRATRGRALQYEFWRCF